MIYVVDSVIIFILFFGVFGLSHTLLASNKLKLLIAANAGSKIAFYRLFFNIISILIFLASYYLAPKPDLIIYDLTSPWDYVAVVFQILSLGLIWWAGTYIDMKEFIGISQIIRLVKGNYIVDTLDEVSEFRADGPYGISRHPVYFFSILFLIFRPTMDLFDLCFVLSLIVYFFVGSIYEERKLENKYGPAYVEYKNRVPRIIPIKLKIFMK